MLQLQRMEISGFKSFGDRTEVRFREGITAVVGPNGCGKSNIGDAINWALGEQSPKLLRGKQMADVIFAGCRSRKPLGMAEVSLHLTGAEGLKHEEQGLVTITRRLFRNGDSEYRINGKRVRLRDIQELLHEARVGARSYATIEQGRIDEILNARPRERRLIIEDAAGVSGYKNKRRLTELKLEATQANLLRVNDIVVEVERQIRSLKRQASRARRYRRLRDELRGKERVRFGVRAAALDARMARLTAREREAKDEETAAAAGLGKLEAELAEERSSLEEAGRAFRLASQRRHELEIEVEREESRIGSCRDRIAESEEASRQREAEAGELAQRLEETRAERDEQRARVGQGRREIERIQAEYDRQRTDQGEIDQAHRAVRDEIEELRRRQFETMNRAAESRNRTRGLEEALSRIGAQKVRLEEERAAASGEHARLRGEADGLAEECERHRGILERIEQSRARCEERIAELEKRLETESAEMAGCREREKSAIARLRTLEDVATRFAGVSDGVRTLLSDGPSAGVRALGVVADFVKAHADVEIAAEGYLQGFLPTVIVRDDADVQRAARLLHSVGAGRTCLISGSQPAGGPAVGSGGNGQDGLPERLVGDPRVRGTLRDRLTLSSASNGVLQGRLGETLLVDSLESALGLHRDYPGVDYLTPEGDVVYASGVVAAGGRASGDRGLLSHNRQVEDARVAASEAGEAAAALQENVEASRSELASLGVTLRERREQEEQARRRQVELEVRLHRSSDETERSGRRTEVLTDESASLDRETESMERELTRLRSEVKEAEGDHAAIEGQLRERLSGIEETEARLRQLSERTADLRAELAVARERQESIEVEDRRLADRSAELESRLLAVRGEADAARRRSAEAAELLARTERDLLDHLAESKLLEGQTAEMEREIAERQRLLSERDNVVRGTRERLESLREATREAELERTRAEADRQHLDELCAQELGLPAGQALADGAPVPQDLDMEALEAEIDWIRQKLEKIGPVNLTAIDEFSELEARHAFLTSQRSDLEQSMVSLRESIRRINRSSRERFSEAFEKIRTSYQEIFQVLFNGGRADLRLEEEEDVLEAGIEILAQPPGKRLSNVQLLSGGEKALSAIALLFAVFRFQPSPFCLLDEVDAALDDANIGRFARMVREYAKQTQFILITHNKLSMESADLLYGVTMDEPGISRVVSMSLQ